MINLIVAVGRKGEIGFQGQIPWLGDPSIANTAREDLSWFSKQTQGGVLVVGRATYREMVRLGFRSGDRRVHCWDGVTNPEAVLIGLESAYDREIWICGGERTYRAFMPYVQRFYISRIPWTGHADRFFPFGEIVR